MSMLAIKHVAALIDGIAKSIAAIGAAQAVVEITNGKVISTDAMTTAIVAFALAGVLEVVVVALLFAIDDDTEKNDSG